MVCFWYIIVNTLRKGDNKDNNNSNISNNNNNRIVLMESIEDLAETWFVSGI